jgi:hypothetical protein
VLVNIVTPYLTALIFVSNMIFTPVVNKYHVRMFDFATPDDWAVATSGPFTTCQALLSGAGRPKKSYYSISDSLRYFYSGSASPVAGGGSPEACAP